MWDRNRESLPRSTLRLYRWVVIIGVVDADGDGDGSGDDAAEDPWIGERIFESLPSHGATTVRATRSAPTLSADYLFARRQQERVGGVGGCCAGAPRAQELRPIGNLNTVNSTAQIIQTERT